MRWGRRDPNSPTRHCPHASLRRRRRAGRGGEPRPDGRKITDFHNERHYDEEHPADVKLKRCVYSNRHRRPAAGGPGGQSPFIKSAVRILRRYPTLPRSRCPWPAGRVRALKKSQSTSPSNPIGSSLLFDPPGPPQHEAGPGQNGDSGVARRKQHAEPERNATVLRRAEMNLKDGERADKAEPKPQCCRHRRTAREGALQTNSASAVQLKIRPATATAPWRCRGRGSRRRFSRTLPARPQIGVHPHLRQTLPHRAGGNAVRPA